MEMHLSFAVRVLNHDAPGSDGRNADGKMRLGLFFEGLGHHIAAWRDPSVDATARQRFSHFVEIAQSAERGKFDLIFTADTFAELQHATIPVQWERTALSSRHEPMTLLAALAAVTEHVGLVATMTSTYYEPIHVARPVCFARSHQQRPRRLEPRHHGDAGRRLTEVRPRHAARSEVALFAGAGASLRAWCSGCGILRA